MYTATNQFEKIKVDPNIFVFLQHISVQTERGHLKLNIHLSKDRPQPKY